jgi:site-specific recombinase XerD
MDRLKGFPMMIPPVPVCSRGTLANLSSSQFHTLADVLPETKWVTNSTYPNNRRAYHQDTQVFMTFVGLRMLEPLLDATVAHVIARRDRLVRQESSNDTIHRKLAAQLSSYAYLCALCVVLYNPLMRVKCAHLMNRASITPATGDYQARMLLEALPDNMLIGQRDWSILATLLSHGLW